MVRVGDTIEFEPKNGGEFPTGETTREAEVEEILDNEIIIRQTKDGFTRRISEEQIVR